MTDDWLRQLVDSGRAFTEQETQRAATIIVSLRQENDSLRETMEKYRRLLRNKVNQPPQAVMKNMVNKA